MSTIKLNWVLAHEPFELFYNAADSFAKEVFEETNGEVEITVMDLFEYNKLHGLVLTTAGRDDRQAVINLVDEGKIDIASVYVNSLALINPDLFVFDMPYLIQDEEHAYKALDGEIGKSLLQGVADKSNVKPIAYTFSGGFRLMPSTSPYEHYKDFENTRVGISRSPVAADTFKSVGALPREVNVEDVRDAMIRNEIDSGETTYPRFFVLGHDKVAKYINHTEHCLFLTSIILNKQLWEKLSEKNQKIFMTAAQNAALIEREETLATVTPVQERAKALGIEVVTMSPAEKQKFINSTKGMYSKYETWFSSGVLSGIMKLH